MLCSSASESTLRWSKTSAGRHCEHRRGKGYPSRAIKALPGSPLPLPHTDWTFGRSFVIIVPVAHWVAAMNRCNWDPGHQGQQQTLHILQDWFWWADMAMQMQKVISNCKWCIQHEGAWAKAPMQPIIATAPLELPHVDFTSIEMTMDLDKPLNMVSILVFCDHFMKHIMAYMTPNQTAKTVAMFLWQGYISIFGTLAKLLGDWGTSFESNVIKELCELLEYRRSGLHLTMLKPMDKLSKLIKCLCTW